MTSLTCPKCGGSDYFLSKRNIVKGMGWLQTGSLKSVPVCRVCDEIMDGAKVGMSTLGDLATNASKYPPYKNTKVDYFIYGFSVLAIVLSFSGSIENPTAVGVLIYGSSFTIFIRLFLNSKKRKGQK
jgi:hypothetical protein